MNSIFSWLEIGAAIIVAFFLLNAIFYRVRRGTFLPKTRREDFSPAKPLPVLQVAVGLVVAVVAIGAAVFKDASPGSDVAVWLGRPLSWLVMLVWSWFALMVCLTVQAVSRHLRNTAGAPRGKSDS